MACPLAVNLAHPLSDHPLNRGRVLWLYGVPPFAGGTVWHDLCRRSAGGVLTSSPAWATAGRSEYALSRTAGGGYANVPGANYLFSAAAPFSVAASVYYPSTPGTFSRIMGTEPTSNTGWQFSTDDSATRKFYLYRGAFYSPAGALTVGRWTRVLFTFNGSQQTGHQDGRPILAASADAGAISAGSALWVGRTPFNAGAAVTVADVSIWSRALSASEAAEDYRQSLAGYPPGGALNYLPRRRWGDVAAAALPKNLLYGPLRSPLLRGLVA